jgi:glyoxylase-like metal-dependent hydrolase (beta-lactamase superfamily II)
MANAWLVDAPHGWVLVDTGLPGYAGRIVHKAELRYGKNTRPHAIILTHGHVDHAGSAARLARLWDVPVFAHRRELPFLDGRVTYPPADPGIGGALAVLARALPTRSWDLQRRLRPLPRDGCVPFLPGWVWVHTPGHTPGHVSLLRRSDRLVLAGDALCTMDRDAWSCTDPGQAHASLTAITALAPWAVAAGHGRPMAGSEVPAVLRELARAFPAGRAVRRRPRLVAVGLLALSAGLVLRLVRRRPRRCASAIARAGS